MKEAVTGLFVVLVIVASGWLVFQIFSGADLNPFDGRSPSAAVEQGMVEVPRRLPAIEEARLDVELSLVDAEFAAKDAAEAMRPENRNIKIDR